MGYLRTWGGVKNVLLNDLGSGVLPAGAVTRKLAWTLKDQLVNSLGATVMQSSDGTDAGTLASDTWGGSFDPTKIIRPMSWFQINGKDVFLPPPGFNATRLKAAIDASGAAVPTSVSGTQVIIGDGTDPGFTIAGSMTVLGSLSLKAGPSVQATTSHAPFNVPNSTYSWITLHLPAGIDGLRRYLTMAYSPRPDGIEGATPVPNYAYFRFWLSQTAPAAITPGTWVPPPEVSPDDRIAYQVDEFNPTVDTFPLSSGSTFLLGPFSSSETSSFITPVYASFLYSAEGDFIFLYSLQGRGFFPDGALSVCGLQVSGRAFDETEPYVVGGTDWSNDRGIATDLPNTIRPYGPGIIDTNNRVPTTGLATRTPILDSDPGRAGVLVAQPAAIMLGTNYLPIRMQTDLAPALDNARVAANLEPMEAWAVGAGSLDLSNPSRINAPQATRKGLLPDCYWAPQALPDGTTIPKELITSTGGPWTFGGGDTLTINAISIPIAGTMSLSDMQDALIGAEVPAVEFAFDVDAKTFTILSGKNVVIAVGGGAGATLGLSNGTLTGGFAYAKVGGCFLPWPFTEAPVV